MPTPERHTDAWYARCAELATQRGLAGAALVDALDAGEAAEDWRALDAAMDAAIHDAGRHEAKEPHSGWRLALALWSVPSGSSADAGHDVLLSVAWDVATHQPYPVLTCSCPAGRYGKPCGHIGCVLQAQEAA